jgi:hypothetical protein
MIDAAPIALFVYNRPEHTRRTVEALLKNAPASESDLFIFSDAAKSGQNGSDVQAVRAYIRSIAGFKSVTVIERAENLGLSKSIISGVTEIVSRFGRVIVLEDDLVTSPYFLEYMNRALDVYESDDRVASIHGYVYPVEGLPETFFLRGADCWGWATWKRGWDLFEADGTKLLSALRERSLVSRFDFDGSYHFSTMLERQTKGETDSWAVRWYASAFLKDKLTLYPSRSLVDNIGQDASGTHKGNSDVYRAKLSENPIALQKIPTKEDARARQMIVRYFRSLKPGIFRRAAKKIGSFFS